MGVGGGRGGIKDKSLMGISPGVCEGERGEQIFS